MIDNGHTPEPLISDADLATGIRENQFVMHYQPKIDTRTLEFVSVEALVRWNHPVLGVLMPDAFIPLAEQGKHIHGITDIVLETALRQSAQWRELGLDLRMSINISGASLEVPDLPERGAMRSSPPPCDSSPGRAYLAPRSARSPAKRA